MRSNQSEFKHERLPCQRNAARPGEARRPGRRRPSRVRPCTSKVGRVNRCRGAPPAAPFVLREAPNRRERGVALRLLLLLLAVAVLERAHRETHRRRQHALARVRAVHLARSGQVLLSDEPLVPSDHGVDERRLEPQHVGDVLERAQPERQVRLEKFVLEGGDDAALDLRVRDLMLGERLVGQHRRDGVPLARDLVLVVLVHAVVHRKVRLQVNVLRVVFAQAGDNRAELLIHLHERLGRARAQVGVDQRGQRGGVVRGRAVPFCKQPIQDRGVERRVVRP
mmetsp:Transcript_9191/g.22068  ORF Transcript_9191/g.22068 Transcript_9191/m.22068 type:complete len:281 (+) Transcript_9191:183-1025(+)